MSESKKVALPPSAIALAAAFLFGASTPAAKFLVGQTNPQLLAGLLYLGSGLGLTVVGLVKKFVLKSAQTELKLTRKDLPWLASAIFFGGILAPLLLMIGLETTSGGAGSLLLNLEAVFTALLAWFVFKENFDRRICLGMLAIVLGSLILSWQPGATTLSWGVAAIVGACFCWALDNNLTRNIAEADPLQIAASKGLVAGCANTAIAMSAGAQVPGLKLVIEAALVGFLGYGVSLVLFILGLRLLGTSRTGAYFSTAPFAGAFLSLIFLNEHFSPSLALATVFMAFGVWLHLTEKHEHLHTHHEEEHEHLHWHDEHHQHAHDSGQSVLQPHSHVHKHELLTHSHPHFPGSRHRHEH